MRGAALRARARCARPAVIASLSACTATGSPSVARAAHPVVQREVVDAREVVDRRWRDMNALKPTTPRAASSSSRPTSPGHEAAPQREVDERAALRQRRASRRTRRRSTVGGWALSGMSIAAVAPPAASARVPVSKPSQSVRPGSLKCTCASTAAGQEMQAGGVDLLASRVPRSSGPSAAIRPSATPTSSRRCAAGADDGCAANQDVEAHPSELEELRRHVDRRRDVLGRHGLGRVVADAAGAADEQHRDRGNRRERDGVVAGAARQADDRMTGRRDRLGNELGELRLNRRRRASPAQRPIRAPAPRAGDRIRALARAVRRRTPAASLRRGGRRG